MYKLSVKLYTNIVIIMKKRIIIDSIILMAISFLIHGVYEMWPNVLTSILFPVNESIWEHGKLILISFVLLYPIKRFIFKDDANSFSSNIITSILCIALTYLIFTPIFLYILKMQDNMVVTIIVYFVCIVLSLIIRELLIRERLEHDFIGGVIAFIALLIIYGILSYNPIKKPIFYDYKKEIYGINIRA